MFDKSKRGIEESNCQVLEIESRVNRSRQESLIELVKVTSMMRQMKMNQCQKVKVFKNEFKEKDREINGRKTRCLNLKSQIEKVNKESKKIHIPKNKEKIDNLYEEYENRKQTKVKRDDKKISNAEQKVEILAKQIDELKLLLQAQEKLKEELSDELKVCTSIGSSLKKFEKICESNKSRALKKYKIKEEYEILIAVELSMLGANLKQQKEYDMREERFEKPQVHQESEEDEEDETSFLAEYESQSERDNEGQSHEDFVFMQKMEVTSSSQMMIEIKPKQIGIIEKEELDVCQISDKKSKENLLLLNQKQQSLQKENELDCQSENKVIENSAMGNGFESLAQRRWVTQMREWVFELICQNTK